MNAPGVAKLSESQPLKGVSIPLVDNLGEVRVERLADNSVRFTDRAGELPPYTLEFSAAEWADIVGHLGR